MKSHETIRCRHSDKCYAFNITYNVTISSVYASLRWSNDSNLYIADSTNLWYKIMTVIIDVHESNEVVNAAKRHCDEVKMWDNFGGDYIAGKYIIERKRWREIAGRMLEPDTHLYYQIEKLMAAAESFDLTPALLVEGDLCHELEHTKLPRERVGQYLTGVSVLEIHQILSVDQENTGSILSKLERDKVPDTRRKRGSPPSLNDEPRFILEGISGLGPNKAEALLDHFGTVENVVLASPEKIATLPGFGDKTAQTISNAFRKEYGR